MLVYQDLISGTAPARPLSVALLLDSSGGLWTEFLDPQAMVAVLSTADAFRVSG